MPSEVLKARAEISGGFNVRLEFDQMLGDCPIRDEQGVYEYVVSESFHYALERLQRRLGIPDLKIGGNAIAFSYRSGLDVYRLIAEVVTEAASFHQKTPVVFLPAEQV